MACIRAAEAVAGWLIAVAHALHYQLVPCTVPLQFMLDDLSFFALFSFYLHHFDPLVHGGADV